MTKLPLPQRVGKTVGGGWGCLFIMIHLALKGWLGRGWLVPILVGLQTPGAEVATSWARQARLTTDPGERICSPHTWGHCLLCQKLLVLTWQ